jgi:hypothetical protein
MKVLLLVLRNNQPADLVGIVLLIVFAFCHHLHLKYDGLIDLLHSFRLLHKQPFPDANEVVEDNRCFNK